MSVVIDGTSGVTTPGVVNTAGETIATTLSVTGVTTLTGGLNAALPVLSGGTGVTTSTGTGAVVLGTSPTLTTPVLGTPTSGNLANCTGIPAPAALSTASGSAPSYSARAWVNFNGTGTPAIRASGNISSVTRALTSQYTVNLTTAMQDADYSVSTGISVATGSDPTTCAIFTSSTGTPTAPTSSSFKMYIYRAGVADVTPTYVCLSIFR